MKYITIKDIAKELSISVSTVSRALVDDKNIRKETKEKVLAMAEFLGYKPNPVALNLKYGRTNTIGVIVPEMVTPFASQVVKGIQRVLFRKGMKVVIAQSDENPILEKENLTLMENFMVDGIIICPCHCSANNMEYKRIRDANIPIVFYDRFIEEKDVSKVIINDYAKAHFLVEHLIRSGRRKIAHLRAPLHILNSYERFKGYRDCIQKFKLDFNEKLVIDTGMTISDGEDGVKRLLKSGESFDAIFAFTDTLAVGAMNYLRDQSIKIPEDVSIAGFSGTVLSTIVYPRLTTVEQPLEKMGETAA
ncbi:MAG: LacI family DNA-binding transcriptional regulator, partial [Dysgonomonas sp.]